ncbi:ribonuclease H-like domain-containing protein [Tanacetum coccineum]
MHDPWSLILPHEAHSFAMYHGTIDHGLQLHVTSTNQLTAYTNVDLVGFPVTQRSTLGYCIFFCLGANLLRELHAPLFTATLVYCDNVSAVYLSTNLADIFTKGLPSALFLKFSLTITGLEIHIKYLTGLTIPAFTHSSTSLAISWLFSEPAILLFCSTGYMDMLALKECMITRLGILVMSEGCHANMSMLFLRRSIS